MSNHTPVDPLPRRTPAIARQLNDRAALELLALHGRLSRTQIRDLMGVAQPTVIEIIKRLERDGHIQAVGEERQVRPGPRAVLYGLVSGQWFVAGANVRDRKITASVSDLAGGPALEIVTRDFDTRALPEQIAEAVAASMRQAGIAPERVLQTVVGVPGVVSPSTGDLGFSWDLPRWHGRLLEPLQELISSPVRLLNGVQLVAFAEAQAPGLQERQTFALLWISTGVGLALMVNGSPLVGASGAAGQVGYTPVPGSPVLPVRAQSGGFDGDLQGLIGADGLRALAKDLGLPARSPSALLHKAAHSLDEGLQGYLGEVARRIAVACASIATVVDPGVFVLQGSTALAGGETLARRVEAEFAGMSPFDATVIVGRHPEHVELEGAIQLGRSLARNELWGSQPGRPGA